MHEQKEKAQRQDKTGQDTTTQDKTRQVRLDKEGKSKKPYDAERLGGGEGGGLHSLRGGHVREVAQVCNALVPAQDKTRQDKTKPKTRQDKTPRQDKTSSNIIEESVFGLALVRDEQQNSDDLPRQARDKHSDQQDVPPEKLRKTAG